MYTKDPVTGRFVSPKAAAVIAEAEQTEAKAAELVAEAETLTLAAQERRKEADALIQAEREAPEWLRALVVAIADQLGISAEEFKARVRIIHPTAVDPVLVVDGKPMVAWV